MNALINLLVKLGLDTDEFEKKSKKSSDTAKTTGEKIVSGLSGIGGAAVVGGFAAVSAGAVAMGAFLREAIPAASDLNETVSKVGVVFGKYSFQMEQWGKSAATSMGMSANEALSAAATYGNLFRSMNMNELASKNMSQGLVQLASDLASFNNMDPTEVMEKLRAGLTGETEPLKTLGVNISATAIEAKALAMGFKKIKGELTPAMKAQASYALIMEQTKTAQGDFARTSDGLANQQRILAAQWEDMKAKVGTALLPVMTTLAKTLGNLFSDPTVQAGLQSLIDGLSKFAAAAVTNLPNVIQWFQRAFGWLGANQGVIVAVLAVIGAAIAVWAHGVIVLMAPVIVSMLPLILTIAAIGAAAYLLYKAWTTNFGGIQEKVAAVWAWLQPVFNNIKTWLAVNIPVALAWLSNTWKNVLLPAIMSVVNWVTGTLIPTLLNVWTWLQANIPAAIQWVVTAWNNFLITIQTVVNWITTTLVTTFETVRVWLETTLTTALATLGGFWTNVLLPPIMAVWGWISSTLLPLFAALGELLVAVVGAAVRGLAWIWSNVFQPAIAAVWNFLSGTLYPFFQTIAGFIVNVFITDIQLLTDIWNKTLLPALQEVWTWMLNTLTPYFNDLVNFITKTFNSAVQGLSDLWSKTLLPSITSVYDFLFKTAWPAFRDFCKFLDNTFKESISKAAGIVHDSFASAFEWVNGKIRDLTAAISGLAKWLNSLGSKAAIPSEKPGGERHARGMAPFTVPAGYPNDSFYMPPMWLTSGETISVVPAGVSSELSRAGDTLNNTVNNNFNLNAQYAYQRETSLRQDIQSLSLSYGVI